ncbi:MAG: hypothetical protein GX933_02250 [Chloroflexi bacterium]|nr:hypothetical protein [Chloroflexota bacterium]
MISDNDSQIKEVYALFGLVYYLSEVVHKSLCISYALMSFDNPSDITRLRFEEKFSISLSMTLGQVLNEVKEYFPTRIQNLLESALAKRNYLAHSFWLETNYLMFSEEGLQHLSKTLEKDVNFFCSLDESIGEHIFPLLSSYGIDRETIESEMIKLQQGKPDVPIHSQRKLNRRETIIKIWEVLKNDGSNQFVFEALDHSLWELCDVGLGWSRFTTVEANWKENVDLKPFLPVVIDPRPTLEKPWNYSFQIGNKAILNISKGHNEKQFHLTFRKPSK